MFVWIRLCSCGLGCVRVDRAVFVLIGLCSCGLAVFGWIGLCSCGLVCVRVDCAVFVWNGLLPNNRTILPKIAVRKPTD
jgi:hypothetical protein